MDVNHVWKIIYCQFKKQIKENKSEFVWIRIILYVVKTVLGYKLEIIFVNKNVLIQNVNMTWMIVQLNFVVKIVEYLKLEMEFVNENVTIRIVNMIRMIVKNIVLKVV